MKFKDHMPFKTMLILCLCLLVLSNQTRIDGGVCVSSPCSSLNESGTDAGIDDLFGESTTSLILAPTGLLIQPTLNLIINYDVRQYVYGATIQTEFDKKSEKFEVNSNLPKSRWLITDETHLYISFFLIKFIILLNLIWWIPLSWLICKVFLKTKIIESVFLWTIIIFTVVIRFFMFFGTIK